MPSPKKPIQHGTGNGYKYHGCRCDDCRAANTREMNELRNRDKPVPPNSHGTTAGYQYYRCRCEKCLIHWRLRQQEYNRKYREDHREELREKERLRRQKRKAERLQAEEALRLKRADLIGPGKHL